MPLTARQARAQSARQQAKQHFLRGVDLFGRGDAIRALAEFEGSYRLNPVPEVLFNIGLTQKSLQRYTDALESFERFIRQSAERPAGLAPARRLQAEKMIGETRSQMGALVLSLSPANVTVRIDGRERFVDLPLYVDPGVHQIEVSASGFAPVQKEVTCAAGKTLPLRIDLRPLAVAAQPAPPPLPPPSPPLHPLPAAESPPSSPATSAVAASLGLTASPGPDSPPPAKKPFWKRWAFWAGVGAGAVLVGTAAGVGGYYASQGGGAACQAGCFDFR
jgi:hypothetical protein